MVRQKVNIKQKYVMNFENEIEKILERQKSVWPQESVSVITLVVYNIETCCTTQLDSEKLKHF